MELKSNVFDTALIFEGGGMRASFSSGIVNTLLENEIYFNYIAGISAGSSCTLNYLSRDIERTKASFVDFVKDPEFGGWKTFLKGKGFFNAEYIYCESCLPGSKLPYNYDNFLNNEADFDIGAYNMDRSEMVYWSRKDVHKMEDLMLMVRASSSLPIFMPPTKIDGEMYVDGGIQCGIALDAAMNRGFEKFVIVLTREKGYIKGPQSKQRILRRMFKDYPKTLETIMKRYVEYNKTMEIIRQLEKENKAFVIYPDTMPIDNREKDIKKLETMYNLGINQGKRQINDLKKFLGMPE